MPVLTDFGLMHKLPSRVQESLPAATSKSLVSGVAEGTPGYAAPEQGDGRGGRKSDVYSIGATLVFAAAYVRPFGQHANSVSIAMKLKDGSTIDIFASMIVNMLVQPLAASLHGGLERNPYIMVCVQESRWWCQTRCQRSWRRS